MFNVENYLKILIECLWPTVQRYFPHGGYIFQKKNKPYHLSNFDKKLFPEKRYHTSPMVRAFRRLITDR